MKIVPAPELRGARTGIHEYHCPRHLFSVVRYNDDLRHIYVGRGDAFSIWIEGCPPVASEIEIWKILVDLGVAAVCVDVFLEVAKKRGFEAGKRHLQAEMKNLLDIQ